MSTRQCSRFVPIAFLVIVTSLLPIKVFGQGGPNYVSNAQTMTGDTMMPIPGGHDYIKMLGETVNPANGTVNFQFSYPMPKARGITIPVRNTFGPAPYSIQFQYPQNTLSWLPNPYNNGQGQTFSFAVSVQPSVTYQCGPYPGNTCQTAPCVYASSFTWRDFDGVSHNLGLGAWAALPNPPSGSTGQCATQGAGAVAPGSNGDGEVTAEFLDPAGFIQQLSSSSCTTQCSFGSIVVTDKNGTSYGVGQGIEDRNGNIILSGNTDSLGRTISSGLPGLAQTIGGMSYPAPVAPPGAPTSVTVSYNVPNNDAAHPCFLNSGVQIGHVSGTQPAWSGVTLPDGTQYTIYFGSFNPDTTVQNSYGLVNEIVFPGGGWIKYQWSINATVANESAAFPSLGTTINNVNVPCWLAYSTPVVAHRYVSYDGQNIAQRQDFTYTTTWPSGSNGAFYPSNSGYWTSKTTTVTTIDYVLNKTTKTVYTYVPGQVPGVANPISGDPWGGVVPVEQSIQYYDWGPSANPIKSVWKSWANIFRLSCEMTTTNGLTAGKTYGYGPGGNVNDVKEYDYTTATGSSVCAGTAGVTPARETTTTLQTFAVPPAIVPICTGSGCQGYQAGAFFYKPSAVITYAGPASSGVRVAETDFSYDQSAPTTASAVHHDDTYYGVAQTVRGNLTTVTRQCFTGSIACSPGTVTITGQYDTTGQLISRTDPCGNASGGCSDMTGSSHTITFSYADNPSGGNVAGPSDAYLTSVSFPVVGAGTFSYNYNLGDLLSSTDENSLTTSYKYGTQPAGCSNPDQLDRLTEVYLPDNPTVPNTINCYNNWTSASAGHLITSTLRKTTVTLMDGMFRNTREQLTSDPDGTDFTDTKYDGEGRTWQVSNPYRTTTDGTTQTDVDGIGRTTRITRQDSSIIQTTYGTACAVRANLSSVTVTDEAGHTRTSCTDGLGRLVEVDEPGSYYTFYNYDILGNLLCVWQRGSDTTAVPAFSFNYSTNTSNCLSAVPAVWRPRSFSYDSLSRLISATNPESGTITYTYDVNGNVSSKIAPQPNQTGSATVTINYSYDVLNRLITKSYVGMSTAAPKYGYDGVALTGCTTTPPTLIDNYPKGRRTSMCDGSGATSWAHDEMGRVITETRKIGGVAKTISYSYNFDGSLKTLTYPTGRVVTYTAGGAGRPVSAIDSTGPINYVTAAHYAPFGALNSWTQGGSINLTDIYNNRLQPCWLYATTGTPLSSSTSCTGTATTGTIQDLKYNFGLGTNDNGNIYQIVNNRDGNRTQNFLYDALNRIAQAYTNGANWGETFSPIATAPGVLPTTPGIDVWGNLTNRSGVTGKTNYEPLNVAPASTKNQLSGFGYDAAGNMTSNGTSTYTYDAENRMTVTGSCTFVYDGDGNRVQKTCGNAYYWRDLAGTTIAEGDGNSINREFIFFSNKRVARRDVSTNAVHYFFSDHLGSTSLVTNASGTMPPEAESDYYPYGGEIVVSSPTIGDQNYKFGGKERDTQTGLDNFGARYDSSALGRFMTPDWSEKPVSVPYAKFGDPQTLNLYAFVENSPVNQADADGHCGEPFLNWGACNGAASAPPNDNGVGVGAGSAPPETLLALSELPNLWLVAVATAAQNQLMSLSLSQKGLDFIERHEGYSSTVYNDIAGNPTIGYGHLIQPGENFSNGINKQQAGQLLAQDTKSAVNAVNGKVTVTLSQTKFDALVDFTYNVGGRNLGRSTLLKNLNAGKNVTERNFTDWNRAGGKVSKGLTSRRTDEWTLFSTGNYGIP